jgi:hypothetical protein
VDWHPSPPWQHWPRFAYAGASCLLALTSLALGTYAGFTGQTISPLNTFGTGTVQLTAKLAGTPQDFAFGTVSNLLPGDSIVRFLDVANAGSLDFTSAMSAEATASSALDDEPTAGLQLEIRQCSVSWAATDVCPGTASDLYLGRLAPLAAGALSLGAVAPGPAHTAHLQLKVTLPASSASMAGLSSTLRFAWTATTS